MKAKKTAKKNSPAELCGFLHELCFLLNELYFRCAVQRTLQKLNLRLLKYFDLSIGNLYICYNLVSLHPPNTVISSA